MHVVRELLARELLMLVVLAALGAGPASILSVRFRAIERVALAPILGMCLGTSVFTTLNYIFRAADTNWLVPVLGAASVALAAVRSRAAGGWLRGREQLAGWASVALVILVITVPVISVLRSQHTVGPESYAVGDAIGYIAEADGEIRQSLHQAIYATPPFPNLAQHYLTVYGQSYQNLDVSSLSANVDSLVGLGAADTFDAFLIAFLIAGALGALAAVRWLLRGDEWPARTLAGAVVGVMFAGAFFLQLLFADSQAGLAGLCVLLPLAAIAADAVIEPRPVALVLVAIMAAGLFAIYPLFVAPTGATAGLVVLYLAVRRWRAGGADRVAALRAGALRVAFVLAAAACMNLVSFTRDLRYWKALVTGGLNPNQFGFPAFDMKVNTVPSWLLQTRNLFTQIPWSGAGISVLVEEIVVPLLLIAMIVVAVRRFRVLVWLVVVIAIAAALGEYEAAKNACSYCTDRSLLPIGPLVAGMVAVGLAILWMSKRRLLRAFAFVVLATWLVPAFTQERDIRNRVSGAGTFLNSSARVVLVRLPRRATIDVEGFDASPYEASPDDPFAYELAEEVSDSRATTPGDVSNNNAIAYFGVSPLNGGQFNPDYQYVLTRLPGIATNRRTVARSDGIALQQRISPLDVTIDGGAVAPSERADPSGTAWVSNGVPLRLIVAGPSTGPAFVGLRMFVSVPAAVPPQPGVVSESYGAWLTVCARAGGIAPFRVAQVRVGYNTIPSGPVTGPYAESPVQVGVQLSAMAVEAGRCPFGNLRPPRQPTSATTA